MQSGDLKTLELAYAQPSALPQRPESRSGFPWVKVVGVILLLLASAWMFQRGIAVRKDAWTRTQGVRFTGDVSNGFSWGLRAYKTGLFVMFDAVANQERRGFSSNYDYPPLRLTVVRMWAAWSQKNFPSYTSWRNDYEMTRWMLRLNTAAELASAILVFLIIRHWRIRMDDARRYPGTPARAFRGVIPGMIGAALMWFNPAVIWDGHCWPQWDVWLVPFFLAAVLLASMDWWFPAGGCILIGAYLKGQMLLGAPILLAWPIMGLQFGAAFRFISGFLFTAAVVTFPWLRPENPELIWLMLVLVAMGLTIPLAMGWKIDWRILVGLSFVGLILAWPWKSTASAGQRMLGPVIVALTMLAAVLPRRLAPSIYAFAIASIVFLMIPLYGASSNWYTWGFANASMKYDTMLAGRGTFNIPHLLETSRVLVDPGDMIKIWWTDIRMNYRQLATWIYGITLVISGLGAAIQAKRNDVRFLICMAAPWVLFYLLMPQMHGRYLLWGAAMAALLAGVDLGMLLIGAIVMGIGFLNIVYNQYYYIPSWDPKNLNNIQVVMPHLGWALIVAAGVYLYVGLAPRTRRN